MASKWDTLISVRCVVYSRFCSWACWFPPAWRPLASFWRRSRRRTRRPTRRRHRRACWARRSPTFHIFCSFCRGAVPKLRTHPVPFSCSVPQNRDGVPLLSQSGWVSEWVSPRESPLTTCHSISQRGRRQTQMSSTTVLLLVVSFTCTYTCKAVCEAFIYPTPFSIYSFGCLDGVQQLNERSMDRWLFVTETQRRGLWFLLDLHPFTQLAARCMCRVVSVASVCGSGGAPLPAAAYQRMRRLQV